MSQDNIRYYLAEVESYLPFRQVNRREILEELRPDLIEATDNGSLDPNRTFGDPKTTAENLVKLRVAEFTPATWLTRGIAYLIDTTIVLLFLLVFVGIPVYFTDQAIDLDQESYTGTDLVIVIALSFYGLFIMFLALLYYFVPEKLYGQSPAKRLLGLYVLDKKGIKMGWKEAIVRNISKSQPEFLFFDFLIGFLLRKDQNPLEKATDIVAETMVVRYTWQD